MTPRRIVLSAVACAAIGTFAWYAGVQNLFYTALTEQLAGQSIDAPTAYALATSGEITLIDIRRPDEWSRTGSPEGAHRLDMRRDDFVTALDMITGADRSEPVALICARGVRSARLGNALAQAGFTNIIDVPEGMLGSASGPGWIKRGLPVNRL